MIKLAPLPYAKSALEPHVSAQTLSFHHGKHHKAYVDKTNKLAKEAGVDGQSVESIIAFAREDANAELYNQSAQVWNHGFYWQSLSPDGGKPSKPLGDAIKSTFGSMGDFKKALKQEATDHFGSGWTWVVAEGGAVFVETTHDAETMACAHTIPLLVIDVWEHAYYLDQQNERKAYVDAVVEKLLNWDFASENFAQRAAWSYPG